MVLVVFLEEAEEDERRRRRTRSLSLQEGAVFRGSFCFAKRALCVCEERRRVSCVWLSVREDLLLARSSVLFRMRRRRPSPLAATAEGDADAFDSETEARFFARVLHQREGPGVEKPSRDLPTAPSRVSDSLFFYCALKTMRASERASENGGENAS
jgi:hypothetical protein